jgi:hypothetical protein
MKRINSITIKEDIDHDPDLSYLGKISWTPTYSKTHKTWIPVEPDRVGKGTEWFSPMNHLPHKKENWSHVSDEDKAKVIATFGSLRKADIAYAYEDCERLVKYQRGDWYMISIRVEAIISVSEDGEHWANYALYESLGGIESDSGDEYIDETKKELLDEMKSQLLEWGFTNEEIDEAMENAEGM